MRPTSKKFTTPSISPANPKPSDMDKDWLVWFRFYDEKNKKWTMFSFKKGINNFHRFKERLAEANALKASLHDELKLGFNPITRSYERTSPLDEVSELCEMPFAEALTFALDKCVVSSTTKKNYRSTVNMIKNSSMRVVVQKGEFQVKQDFSIIPINEIRRKHIRLLLDQVKKDNKWSNKAFNKHLGYFKSILSRLVEYDVIDANPAHKIPTLAVAESEKFIPYTEEEKKIIREHLYNKHFGFFIYLMIIYHTGIRPKEILALKVRDINFEESLIRINPDLDLENTKTKKIREVPLIPSLVELLLTWLENKHTDECYIFGSPYTSGRGNAGSAKGKLTGAMHPDYFKPSKTQIKRDTVTKLWKKIVIDELKINKHLYAAKHTGADDKILAGIDLEALRELYGHHSKQMTEIYVSKLKEIHRKKIIDLSPEF